MPEEKIDWLEDIEFGKGKVEISGRRHMIVDSTVFFQMREMMRKIVDDAADRMIYNSAKEHVKGLIKNKLEKSKLAGFIRRFEWGKKKISEKCVQILTQYGFGEAELKKFNPEGETVVILKDSIIGKWYDGEAEGPTCSYIAGDLAGAFSVIMEKDGVCEEVKCIGKGDEHCKFIIETEE